MLVLKELKDVIHEIADRVYDEKNVWTPDAQGTYIHKDAYTQYAFTRAVTNCVIFIDKVINGKNTKINIFIVGSTVQVMAANEDNDFTFNTERCDATGVCHNKQDFISLFINSGFIE